MSETKHTQGKLELLDTRNFTGTFVAWVEMDGRRLFSIRENSNIVTKEQFIANAERLVKCWNNFDALLEACKAIKTCLLTHGEWDERCFYYAGKSAPELQEPLALIEAAIAATEGKVGSGLPNN